MGKKESYIDGEAMAIIPTRSVEASGVDELASLCWKRIPEAVWKIHSSQEEITQESFDSIG